MLFELLKSKKVFTDEKGDKVEYYQLFIVNKELGLKFPISSSWSKTNEKTRLMYQTDTKLLKSFAYEDITENHM